MNMMKRVRIKETGQVLEMAPAPATAMILGGTAEEVDAHGKVIPRDRAARPIETQMVKAAAEQAVAPAHHAKGQSRKRA
jgi:hypothetical protein